MGKAILEFNLPEEEDSLQLALSAGKMRAALSDVAQSIFRPARKHGYSDNTIEALLSHLDNLCTLTAGNEIPKPLLNGRGEPMDATDLIYLLEKKFHEILDEYGISDCG